MCAQPPHQSWLSACVVTFLVILCVVMFSGCSCRLVFRALISFMTEPNWFDGTQQWSKTPNSFKQTKSKTRTVERVTITSYAFVHCCAKFLRYELESSQCHHVGERSDNCTWNKQCFLFYVQLWRVSSRCLWWFWVVYPCDCMMSSK